MGGVCWGELLITSPFRWGPIARAVWGGEEVSEKPRPGDALFIHPLTGLVIILSTIEFGLLIFNHKEGGSVSLLVINLEIKIVDCFGVALVVSQELNLH